MGYKETYELWKTNPSFDEKDRAELASLTDEKEIEDRFYKDLEFGTAGLRGVLGVGSNRMNKYNIRRATTAFAKYLINTFGDEAKKKGIVIAYDCRNFSKEFAHETACTMCENGVPAKLYSMISATPLLSWSVRALDCVGGVVVTASHNPAEYNGYKVYDETGCQIGEETANAITAIIDSLDITSLKSMDEEKALESGMLTMLGDDEQTAFIHDVEKSAGNLDAKVKADLKIVYTPLHGAGKFPVQQMFK
ncbi:MAG: phospho-sugar mutase, partial [Bacillota bacterium]|nr:phospho-sugar mutase [Bacillota bacterium]